MKYNVTRKLFLKMRDLVMGGWMKARTLKQKVHSSNPSGMAGVSLGKALHPHC